MVLEKLRGDLNTSLEKLTTREKFLNEQFDRQMQQYRAQRVQLQDIQVGPVCFIDLLVMTRPVRGPL